MEVRIDLDDTVRYYVRKCHLFLILDFFSCNYFL